MDHRQILLSDLEETTPFTGGPTALIFASNLTSLAKKAFGGGI